MKNRIQRIIQGLLWVITIVPAAYVMKHCIIAFFNGTYHGFNSDEKIYLMVTESTTLKMDMDHAL